MGQRTLKFFPFVEREPLPKILSMKEIFSETENILSHSLQERGDVQLDV
jgi:hypothetical protein